MTEETEGIKNEEEKSLTNRKWQNHFKSKGFIPFMYDRLQSYSLSQTRQYQDSPFNFSSKEGEDNPLAEYYFEFIEEFPYDLYIEITSYCNLNCIFCARKNMTRQNGFMPMELYKKIIDEIAEKRPFAHVHLYGIGESTIDPGILDKIKYAIDKGVTNLILFTNGKNLLDNDFYKKLVDTGIANIGVDIDGFSKETYEKIRVGSNFENLKKAIVLLHDYVKEKNRELNRNTRVELAYQVYEDLNRSEKEPFVEWAKENGYEFKFVLMHQWAGLREDIPTDSDDKSRSIQRTKPCCALWTCPMILWNGDVTLCFLDADGKEVVGNINNSTIEDIWKNKSREKRKEHVQGTFKGQCSSCKEFLFNNLPECNSRAYPKVLREKSNLENTNNFY